MNTVYGVTRQQYKLKGEEREAYGIAAYAHSDETDTATVICSVDDISGDYQKVAELVELCNTSELSAEHLNDVVDDFLNA